ncbi:hypothetical protein PpBr36_04805 [Pyricularia pennisetigena]|uniref:hypothetical protein n=1 Tax=Pyricularia pennisetigena TaxID=1578925 RepID=UPI0011534B6B|nr:hypothetical protein PpBr36_04805 [Pyricularia pennisetigena]TLS26813.1 hypothetical protein PpBr36_04805 [Pyricularia pennisetigena]
MLPKTFFTAALGLMAASTALATPVSHGNQVATISTRSPEPLSLDDIFNGIKKGIEKLKEKVGGGKKDSAPNPGSDSPPSNSTLKVRMHKRTPEPLGVDDVISGVKAGIDLIKGLKGGDNSGNGDASESKLSQMISKIKGSMDALKNLFKGGKKEGGKKGGEEETKPEKPGSGPSAGGNRTSVGGGNRNNSTNSTTRASLHRRVVYLHD